MVAKDSKYLLAYRSYSNITLKGPLASSEFAKIQNEENTESFKVQEWNDNFRAMAFSPDGLLVAIVSNESVSVFDVKSRELTYQYSQKNIIEISFSPKGSFLSTWQRPVSSDPSSNEVHQNLIIHHLPTNSIIFQTSQKSQTDWKPQWIHNESQFALVSTPGQLQFFSAEAPCTLVTTLTADNLRQFSLSPGPHPHVAIFVPEGKKNGVPAMVKLFSLKNLKLPLSSKTFFKTDTVKFLWNLHGTGVLILTSTDVDATGQSYYGQSTLYYMSTMGNFDCRVPLEGPIHDISWAPNSKDFAVTYGFMPSKTVLFSHRADPIFDFGTSSRNTLSFSPNGRILCIGGFGNLPGELDFWDLGNMQKLVTVRCPNSTYLEWSPDGRYLLTATLAPRLRVDNGWKLWHYRGVCIAQGRVPVLLQIGWQPSLATPDLDAWKLRKLSPAPLGAIDAAPAPTAGKYIPPSARRGPPGTSGAGPAIPTVVGATLLKPVTKKRGGPPSSPSGSQELHAPKQPHTTKPVSAHKPTGVSSTADVAANTRLDTTHRKAPSPPPMTEAKKKSIILQKKLKQIQTIKKKKELGETLTEAQASKLQTEVALRQELKALSINKKALTP